MAEAMSISFEQAKVVHFLDDLQHAVPESNGLVNHTGVFGDIDYPPAPNLTFEEV